MLSEAQWQRYRDVVNSLQDSFNQDNVSWYRFNGGMSRYGEESSRTNTHTLINIKALISYNYFVTWPITDENKGGSLDKESILMCLNNQYLLDNHLMNTNGVFQMDPGRDYFIHKGITYRSAGESQGAQAGTTVLMTYIILKREETLTGKDKY